MRTCLAVAGAVLLTVSPVILPASLLAQKEQVETNTKKVTSGPTFTPVTDAMLQKARSDGKNWLMIGRDYTNQRWSPLTQINTTNVTGLHVNWIYQTGISRLGSRVVCRRWGSRPGSPTAP